MTPNEWKNVQESLQETSEREKSDGDLATALHKSFGQIKGFHILARRVVSENEVSFDAAYSGIAGASEHRFTKVDREWKLAHDD